MVLFTAKPKIKQIERLMKSNVDLFDEVFRWDQKLHVLNFFEDGKDYSALASFCS